MTCDFGLLLRKLFVGAVAAVGVAAVAAAEVVGGGEDEEAVLHVEVFGPEGGVCSLRG